MSDQQQEQKPLSWAEKMRLAKEQSAVVNNVPATVVVAPIINSAGKAVADSDSTKIDTTHTLFNIPDADKGTLVLDTNAFIKGFDNFLQTADVYISTAAVIQECRDRKTRDFLDRLPVSIEILEPTTDSMKKVINVAEKTGDLGMLSKTDLQLCALALDVAKQKNALQEEITPGAPSVNSQTVDVDDDEESDEEFEEEEETDEDDDGNWLDESSSDEDDQEVDDAKKKKTANNKKKKQKEEAEKKKQQAAALPTVNLPGWGNFDDDWSNSAQDQKQPGELSKNQQKKLAKQQRAAEAAAAAAASGSGSSAEQKPEEEKKSVTVVAPAENEQKTTTQVEELAKARQASAYTGGFSCVTSDFPMQNVLLHCGVPVVGSNGQCIRELRVWVLRCHACTAIVHDTLRQFCPECGSGDTLKRVHYVVNDKGEKHLFVNFRHRISTRGTIFNLSKPRGGRKGTNKTMVLREDQLRHCGKVDAKERFMKQQRENFSGFGDDEDDGLAGFGERDGRSGRRDGNFMMEKSSYTRKNVTEARKVRASRKR